MVRWTVYQEDNKSPIFKGTSPTTSGALWQSRDLLMKDVEEKILGRNDSVEIFVEGIKVWGGLIGDLDSLVTKYGGPS